MGGSDDQNRDRSLQPGIDRSPGTPRRLHGNVRAACRREPVCQARPIGRHGGKRAYLLGDAPILLRDEEAGDDEACVEVAPAPALRDNLHGALPLRRRDDGWRQRGACLAAQHYTPACCPARGATLSGAQRHPGQTVGRLAARESTDLWRQRPYEEERICMASGGLCPGGTGGEFESPCGGFARDTGICGARRSPETEIRAWEERRQQDQEL
jgi:hypothetical protein